LYHVHLENLKGAPRWPLKDPRVTTRGVARHIEALLAPCRTGVGARAAICENPAMLEIMRDVDAATAASSG
jgi:hypothetical protein